jgi:hypothetical protein
VFGKVIGVIVKIAADFGCATQKWRNCRSARLSNKSERTLYLEFLAAGWADALVRGRPPGRPSSHIEVGP